MGTWPFYIVDVFAEEKYAGNQLAVFRDTKGLSDREMQVIAKEMNYSETTFILSDEEREGGFDVRIFTPEKEVPFAGHPTLGTAYVIQREIVRSRVEKILLNLKVGQIPVMFDSIGEQADVLWMRQIHPTFGDTIDPGLISEVLRLEKDDIDVRFPVQEVSTGLPFIIVPLKTLNTIKRSKTNRDKYFELIKEREAKAILIFGPETYSEKNDLNVRVFADYYGVPEDPATGSGNGCLAGYLAHHQYFGEDLVDIKVEQGYEIGRPSLLLLRAEEREGKIHVFVGGRVVMIAKGEFL
ncbi:MAG: PhzF family phenazine biosynthesis protein [Candidatus Wukongarchaeota archaeon]|nr:PhzF family phenazine biosynthesis protein [Candidatus Wukongarchaeota archaeon]